MFPKQLVTRGYSTPGTDQGTDSPGDLTHDQHSVSLNGTDEYIAICNTDIKDQLNATGSNRQVCWQIWFKRTSSNNNDDNDQTIISTGTVAEENMFKVFIADGETEIKYKWGNDTTTAIRATGLNITNNQWHFLDVRIFGTIVRVILDGRHDLIVANNETLFNTDGPGNGITYLATNMQDGTAAEFFPGKLANVVISNKGGAVPSGAWAAEHYNGGELSDPSEWTYGGIPPYVWLRMGDATSNMGVDSGSHDGKSNLVFYNAMNDNFSDELGGNGTNPGTNIANWTDGGAANFTATDTYATSAASGGSASTLTYAPATPVALWPYLVYVISSASEGSSASTITYAGNTLKNEVGWAIDGGEVNSWVLASNTNDLEFSSHQSSAMEIREAQLLKPESIAYGVGLVLRGAGNIGVDSP